MSENPLDGYGFITWEITAPKLGDSVEDQIFLLKESGLPISYTALTDGRLMVSTRSGYAGVVILLIRRCLDHTYPGYSLVVTGNE